MKIIGIIPARYKSSRFEGKPLAIINGKPMIWWVYQQAVKVNDLSDVYVATDHSKIYDMCRAYGMKVIMTSENHRTGTDRLGEVSKAIKSDFYINIQGDEPLIEVETIQAVIDYKKRNMSVNVINTMTSLVNDIESRTIVKVASTEKDDLIYLSRMPIPFSKEGREIKYYKHLGLYGLSPEALDFFANTERGRLESIEDIEMLRFIENGKKIKVLLVDSNSIGVDVPDDIKKVERRMKKIYAFGG